MTATLKTSKRKNWKGVVLRELISFIEDRHSGDMSLKSIAEVTGLSVGNISAMMIRDDMKLSRAEEIVSAYGFRLRLFFPLREYPVTWAVRTTERKYPDAGNLEGLVKYLHDSNITVNHMSTRIGSSHCVIDRAFKTGDIFLSTLYTILENLNIEVIWMYEPLNTDLQ